MSAATRSTWRQGRLRHLLLVFLLNGVASAAPATLLLFFVRDRPPTSVWETPFLAAHFLAGAALLPLWVRLVALIGLVRSWAAGMALTIVTFAGAVALGTGDALAFLLVGLSSGLACAVLPCLLKLLALFALWRLWLRDEPARQVGPRKDFTEAEESI